MAQRIIFKCQNVTAKPSPLLRLRRGGCVTGKQKRRIQRRFCLPLENRLKAMPPRLLRLMPGKLAALSGASEGLEHRLYAAIRRGRSRNHRPRSRTPQPALHPIWSTATAPFLI